MTLSAHDRVLAACAFRTPDRIPVFDSFWDFPNDWRKRLGDRAALSDIAIWYPDETPFPLAARRLKEEHGYVYEIDGWGRTVRHRANAFFVETLQVAIPAGVDPEGVRFDPPQLDERYLTGKADPSVTFAGTAEAQQALAEDRRRHCVFGKTGGPYLRSTYVRGETQLLVDLASDVPLARAVADKVADHLAAVGVEQIRRWHLQDTGIWIYDDMAYNRGPMFSPRQFEQVFLPAYRRMIRAYKHAGAKYVFLHSDGDIRIILDMLVDAGIDGLNPLERRAGMDIVKLRQRYPRLILTGGMCNTHTLVRGSKSQIEAEAREIIDLGRAGGVVIGTHSISPEIPLENYLAYREFALRYGDFAPMQKS
jgi:uroporphyrinogen-III decarboxylase